MTKKPAIILNGDLPYIEIAEPLIGLRFLHKRLAAPANVWIYDAVLCDSSPAENTDMSHGLTPKVFSLCGFFNAAQCPVALHEPAHHIRKKGVIDAHSFVSNPSLFVHVFTPGLKPIFALLIIKFIF